MLTLISGATAKHLLVGRGLTAATLTSTFALSHTGFWGGTTSSTLSANQHTFYFRDQKVTGHYV